MSSCRETELAEQVNDPVKKPEIGPMFQPQQSGCPIAREITHRLQIPPISTKYAVDVGGVCLSRDDFCPKSADCALCSFVAKARPAGTNSPSQKSVHFVLDTSTNRRLRRWMDTPLTSETPPLHYVDTSDLMIAVTSGPNIFQRVRWHAFGPREHPREHGTEGIIGTLRLWKYQSPKYNVPAPKPNTLTYISKETKGRLGLCDESHEVCKFLVLNFTPPISLVDCNQRCIVHGHQGIRYVALSYVWGKTGRNFNVPERKYGAPLDGLPRTISDAITVTKSLGYDYLWVDMLCIDQQSKEDKHRQISIMDQIYRSADLTIIIATGSDCGDGIPGVSGRRRPPRLSITIGNTILVEEKEDAVKEIEASIWRSRGWTFQEGLLSSRRLVFTDSRILFSCLYGSAIESREGPEFSHNVGEGWKYMRENANVWDSSFLHTDAPPRTTLVGHKGRYSHLSYGFPITFAELLEKYSTLDFSFESDIPNAFRAIGNTFALRTPPALHLYGLPFIFDDVSTTASSITRGLAWSLERCNEETARRPDFPSWSWLGYRGPVRWGAKLRDGPTGPINRQWSAKTFSHVRSMITISNKRFGVPQLSQWWQEWNSAKESDGLTPSKLMILVSLIQQQFWLGSECTSEMELDRPLCYILTGKEAWFPDSQYNIGNDLLMSADACQYLLEKLRRGSWKALLLTDDFLLIVQSVVTNAEGGPYRRVASADINIFHTKEHYRMERDEFVKKCTELVNIELV